MTKLTHSVKVSALTHKRLEQLKRGAQTYDDIICALMEEVHMKHKRKHETK